MDLVEELCATHKLIVVGTIKSNSRGLPEEVKEAGGREEQSSVFAWSDKVMLVSYVRAKATEKCVGAVYNA